MAKMRHQSKTNLLIEIALILIFGPFFSGCLSSVDTDFRKAENLYKKKNFSDAAAAYERIGQKLENDPKAAVAANEAAKIYQYDLKKFDLSVRNYQIVVFKSPDPSARREAQIKIANLLFYDIQEFQPAIGAYFKLLELPHGITEEIEWRNRIAKSYYYLGNYFQAEIEADKVSKIATGIDEEAVYQAYLLKANIDIGAKKHDKAADVLTAMLNQFPDRSKRDSIALMLAVAYEEQRDFAKAIEVLEKVRDDDPRKSFYDEKIRSIKERASQQPGAKGYRR